MAKKTQYQKLIEPKVQKIIEDIDKIKKLSLTKDYTADDVKLIETALKSSANRLSKHLINNLEDAETFSFDEFVEESNKDNDSKDQNQSSQSDYIQKN